MANRKWLRDLASGSLASVQPWAIVKEPKSVKKPEILALLHSHSRV